MPILGKELSESLFLVIWQCQTAEHMTSQRRTPFHRIIRMPREITPAILSRASGFVAQGNICAMDSALNERYVCLHHLIFTEDAGEEQEAVLGVPRRSHRIDAPREFSTLELEAELIGLPYRLEPDDEWRPYLPRTTRLFSGSVNYRMGPQKHASTGSLSHLLQTPLQHARLEYVVARQGIEVVGVAALLKACLLYTSPSPRDRQKSRMPSSA